MHGNPLANVQYAFANPQAIGDTLLVPAQAGTVRIRVVSLLVIMSAATQIKFTGSQSGDLTATFPVLANGGFVLPLSNYGWFETQPGEALSVNLGSTSTGGVQVAWLPMTS